MDIEYRINGALLSSYGVYVAKSDGLLSQPNYKKPTAHSWPEYHGEVVDLGSRVCEPRAITLDCFITATSSSDFLTKCNTFLNALNSSGTFRLSVVVDPTKPLLYEVYLESGLDVKKKWDSRAMVGTFTIKLREPEPVKRVIRYERKGDGTKTASLTITTSKLVNIYWGDNTSTLDVSGTSKTVTHEYTTNGVYHIVITGNIDEIQTLTHNGTLLWSRL